MRFVVLATLLLLVPAFIYLTQKRATALRDPATGEWVLGGVMQSVQGHNPPGATTTPFFEAGEWGRLMATATHAPQAAPIEVTTTLMPSTPVPPATANGDVPVQGAYAPKMTNATAKYVRTLTPGPSWAARRGASYIQ